jgi:hypothetical protein
VPLSDTRNKCRLDRSEDFTVSKLPERILPSTSNLILGQVGVMPCTWYVRLRQLYEAALRRLAEVELSSHGPELFDGLARLMVEIRRKACCERDAAFEQMRLHQQGCPFCRELAEYDAVQQLMLEGRIQTPPRLLDRLREILLCFGTRPQGVRP